MVSSAVMPSGRTRLMWPPRRVSTTECTPGPDLAGAFTRLAGQRRAQASQAASRSVDGESAEPDTVDLGDLLVRRLVQGGREQARATG